jgi:RNA polymerase sigma-70 factor (sigma-E family)
VPDADGSADLEQLLAEHGERLMRTAVLLAGSHTDGQDLLQGALERLLRMGRRIEGSPESYLRRTMYNLAADGWRRQGAVSRKLTLFRASAAPCEPDATAAVDLRDALMQIIRLLPPQQRAVIVLRYWEQLTQAETAAVLGCSEGTVKSAASRGLARMRDLAGPWQAAAVQQEEAT